jgi:hypothetical protein
MAKTEFHHIKMESQVNFFFRCAGPCGRIFNYFIDIQVLLSFRGVDQMIDLMQKIKDRDPAEKEFHQAVQEVLESVKVVNVMLDKGLV